MLVAICAFWELDIRDFDVIPQPPCKDSRVAAVCPSAMKETGTLFNTWEG